MGWRYCVDNTRMARSLHSPCTSHALVAATVLSPDDCTLAVRGVVVGDSCAGGDLGCWRVELGEIVSMDYRKLYGHPPGASEFAERCTQIANLEAEVIDYILSEHGVNAEVRPHSSLITKQFFAFSLDLIPGRKAKVKDVFALQTEIALAISNLRGVATHLRVQDVPLVIEVPNPWPQAISWKEANWKIGSDKMIVGRSYDVYRGKYQLHVDFQRNQHHALVAGASGAGKSVLLSMMLFSLALNNSPRDVELWMCDLKGQDLPLFRSLPHVRAVATTIEDAEQLIARLHDEVERRKQNHGGKHHPRIVLVIDEQAELRNSRTAVDQQNSIMALGRGLNVNVITGTQDPTKEQLGGLSMRNISVKVVGAVENADAARYATGRPGTGAQYLPRGGAFLYIDGPEIRRFQSYLVEKERVTEAVRCITQEWNKDTGGYAPPPLTLRQAKTISAQVRVAEPESGDKQLTEYVERARQAFNEYWDANANDLAWGGKSAVVRAIFGDDASTGGKFDKWATRVVNHLVNERKTTTTPVETSKVLYMHRKTAS